MSRFQPTVFIILVLGSIFPDIAFYLCRDVNIRELVPYSLKPYFEQVALVNLPIPWKTVVFALSFGLAFSFSMRAVKGEYRTDIQGLTQFVLFAGGVDLMVRFALMAITAPLFQYGLTFNAVMIVQDFFVFLFFAMFAEHSLRAGLPFFGSICVGLTAALVRGLPSLAPASGVILAWNCAIIGIVLSFLAASTEGEKVRLSLQRNIE